MLSQSFIVQHIKNMMSLQDDKSDRASIVMEGFFFVCLTILGFFMLQSESLRSTPNGYLIPTAVTTLVIAAALVGSILFRFRRLHVAVAVAKRDAAEMPAPV